MTFIISALISAAAFYLAAKLLPGVTIKSFTHAILVALAIVVLNVTLGLALKVMTLGILSLGIFKFILSAILIQVADYFLDGLKVQNFLWALALAGTVAVIDGVFNWIL